uniref:Uncharacterized protein n=1 Tax=Romanomermis culicivorax TaxID=13658 RepID=A0A915J0K1_ROMCU
MVLVRIFVEAGRMHLACLLALSMVLRCIIASFLLTAIGASGMALLSFSMVAFITRGSPSNGVRGTTYRVAVAENDTRQALQPGRPIE